jgi:nitrogen-specific signal transduction histidine kinase
MIKKYVLENELLDRTILNNIIRKQKYSNSFKIKIEDKENIIYLFVNIHYIDESIILSFTDFTKLNEFEENKKVMHSLEVLGEISSQFAHEIKNLIQPLKLLIPKNTLPDSEDLPMIHSTISKMGKQISDYLILGKPVDIVQESAQNIKNICDDIFNIIEVSLDNKNLSLKTNIDYNIKPYLDKKHIELILINLITNAIEASYKDSDIIITWQQSKNNSTLLKIENSGKTIPENIQKKIFKPFFTTKKEGSGLGLFSIYKIVYTAKGRIEVMSKNEHTVFEIFIPNRNSI